MAHDGSSNAHGIGLTSGWHDFALAELSPQLRVALQTASLPFLNSLRFCTIYDHPPAQRVWLFIDGSGAIVNAVFYRERTSCGILKLIEGVGFPDFSVSDADVLQLIASRKAHLAIINRLESPSGENPTHAKARNRMELTCDVIVDLPASKDEYLKSLGKQKRQQLPRYWRRIQREYNDQAVMRFESGPTIQLDHIVHLVRFNQTRMETLGKDNSSEIEAKKQERRWPLTQTSGLLCAMEANGRLLGGTFNYVHGDEAFLIVIAHDPVLEHLNIGHVGLWKTVEHLIDLGVTRYHLFWGKKLYKTQFGGVDHPVVRTIISRHRWLISLWKSRMIVGFQIPRAVRFVRSKFRRSASETSSKPVHADEESADE